MKIKNSLKAGLIIQFSLVMLLLAGCTIPAGIPHVITNFLGIQSNVIQCEDIVLGILIGDENDSISQEQRDGYTLAQQQINAAGGVAGCDLQVRYQTESADANSRQTYLAVRALVEEDKAIAFLGGTSNPASMYAASLANYFGIPALIPSAGGAHILPEENLWAFRLHANEDDYAGMVFEMIASQMGNGARVAVIFENTTFGNDAAVAAVNAIDQNELEVAGYFAFDAAKTSYSVLADSVLTSQAQVLYLVFSSPEQAANILEGLKWEETQAYYVWVARAGGFATQNMLLNTGSDRFGPAENMILVSRWSEGAAVDREDPFLEEYARYSLDKYGSKLTPSQYTSEAYKSMLIAAGSLETSLTTGPGFKQDIQQLRESIRQVLFNYKETSGLWGTIDFSSGGQNQDDLVLLQCIADEWQIVFPADRAEMDPQGLLRTE